MFEWLDKLQQAYELLEKYRGQGAMALREFAEFLHKVESGARDVADFIDGPRVVFGAAGDTFDRVEALRVKTEALAHPPRGAVGAGGFWITLGAQILLRILEEILKKRQEDGAEEG